MNTVHVRRTPTSWGRLTAKTGWPSINKDSANAPDRDIDSPNFQMEIRGHTIRSHAGIVLDRASAILDVHHAPPMRLMPIVAIPFASTGQPRARAPAADPQLIHIRASSL